MRALLNGSLGRSVPSGGISLGLIATAVIAFVGASTSYAQSYPPGTLLDVQPIDDSTVCAFYGPVKSGKDGKSVKAAKNVITYITAADGKVLGKPFWMITTVATKLADLNKQIAKAKKVSSSKVSTKKLAPSNQLQKLLAQKNAFTAMKRQLKVCSQDFGHPERIRPILFSLVKPVLEKKCMVCHGSTTTPLWENTNDFYLKSSRIVAGNLEISPLYRSLKGNPNKYTPGDMPQGGSLANPQIYMIARWILDNPGIVAPPPSTTPTPPPGSTPTPNPNATATPVPTPTIDPKIIDQKKGQLLLSNNGCLGSCHSAGGVGGSIANKTQAQIAASIVNVPTMQMYSFLTPEEMRLMAVALTLPITSSRDESATLVVGTVNYMRSYLTTLFLPDDESTYTAADQLIKGKITDVTYYPNKAVQFGGMDDCRFRRKLASTDPDCLPEMEMSVREPRPTVVRSALVGQAFDNVLAGTTKVRATENILSKIGRTPTSPIDKAAILALYDLIFNGNTLPDRTADSFAQITQAATKYSQADRWTMAVDLLCTSSTEEAF